MPREISIEAPEGYPLFGWTDEGVRNYIENKPLAVGDVMIIYNGQAGFHEYSLAVVDNPASGKQRRVILSKSAACGGSSFYRTGRNCFSPKGQSLKAFQSAKSVIAGIELMHMIRKGQLINGCGCGKASFADQFYALAK